MRRDAESLIRDREFDRAYEVLGEGLAAGVVSDTGTALVHSVRQLCLVASRHRELRESLEASVRHQRTAEELLRPLLVTLLGRWSDDATGPRGHPSAPADLRRRPGDPLIAPTLTAGRGGAGTVGTVEVHVLGPLGVRVRDLEIAKWGSLKARAVFAYLVLHRERSVRRDVLMEAFWPGYSHASARNNLNAALYNLRRTLNECGQFQYVLHTEGSYMLNPDLTWLVDRDEFLMLLGRAREHRREGRDIQATTAYAHALSLYGGPLLEDEAIAEWHLTEQRRLDELQLQALDEVGDLYLGLGEPALAEGAAHRALARDPCRESAHRLLMRCYDRQQQHQLVQRQLEACITALRRQLGITPAPETMDLVRTLTRS